jgi:hypothetical protein
MSQQPKVQLKLPADKFEMEHLEQCPHCRRILKVFVRQSDDVRKAA